MNATIKNPDFNNALYRLIRIAYRLDSDDVISIWRLSGVNSEITNGWVRQFIVTPGHKYYRPLSGKELSKFLIALCTLRKIPIKGVGIRSLMDSIFEYEKITTTGNLLVDAETLKEKLRGHYE